MTARIIEALTFSWWAGFIILIGVGSLCLIKGFKAKHKALFQFAGLMLCLATLPIGFALSQTHQIIPEFLTLDQSLFDQNQPNRNSSATVAVNPPEPSIARSTSIYRWLLIGYSVGVIIMTLRLLLGLSVSRKLNHIYSLIDDSEVLKTFQSQVERLKVKSQPLLGLCEQITVPIVVGVIRPVVLLPTSMLSRLTTEQLEMILAHELAHIRRNDHRLIFLQRLTETLLFFHPGVWIMSRWLDRERENACDDLVLELGSSEVDYAETLVAVSELDGRIPGLLNLAASGQAPGELSRRIHRILKVHIGPPIRFSRLSFTTFLLIVAGLCFLLTASQPTIAIETGEPSKDGQIAALKERIRQLESKHNLADVIKNNQQAAAARRNLDSKRFGKQELLDVERKFRKAVNGTVEDLEEFVTSSPNCNRTGCAVLLLGRRFQDDTNKEKYFREAIKNYSDCYYGDGVQVGPYARFFLAHLYLARGRTEDAKQLFDSVLAQFPNAITHEKRLLATLINELADRPKVIRAIPDNGERTVNPNLKELLIEFDRPMNPTGWTFAGEGRSYPKITGKPRWLDDKTIVLPVRLRHSREYRLSINSNRSKNFRSEQGAQAVSYPIRFKTSSAP